MTLKLKLKCRGHNEYKAHELQKHLEIGKSGIIVSDVFLNLIEYRWNWKWKCWNSKARKYLLECPVYSICTGKCIIVFFLHVFRNWYKPPYNDSSPHHRSSVPEVDQFTAPAEFRKIMKYPRFNLFLHRIEWFLRFTSFEL